MPRFERILVTGGAGQLGRYVAAELAGDFLVTILDPAVVEESPQRIRASVLDIPAVKEALKDQDAVVHLAGIDAAIEAPPELLFQTNVQGTWNVLHMAEEIGIKKAVTCSSVAASGFRLQRPRIAPRYLPVDEAHPLNASTTYGMSKMVGEQVAQSIARRGRMDVVCLCPAYVAFPNTVTEVDRVARTSDLVDPGEAGGANDAADISILRAYVRPEDVARCFKSALEKDTDGFDRFHVAADDTFSPAATLDVVARQYGTLPEIRDTARYVNDERAAAFDNSRAKALLDWHPQGSWSDAMAQAQLEGQ